MTTNPSPAGRPARLLAPCLVLALLAGSALAQPSADLQRRELERRKQEERETQTRAPALRVGDPAPKLSIATWVKGEPVAEVQKGNVYVVEFWFKDCAPCRALMPHLTELQAKHKDEGLRVIGVNHIDPLAAVQNFVRGNDARMGYTIAVDNNDQTKKAWFDASGGRGYPHAIVVGRDGKVAYIGHPGRMDAALSAALAVKAEAPAEKPGAPSGTPARPAAGGSAADDPRTVSAVADLVAGGKLREAAEALEAGLRDRKLTRLTYRVQRMNLALGPAKDPVAGYALARQLIRDEWANDAPALDKLAADIIDRPDPATRDYSVAVAAAARANAVTREQNPDYLARLANAQWLSGNKEAAIRTQRLAIARAPEGRRPEFQASLDAYTAKR